MFRSVLEGDVETFDRQKLDWNVLKSPLFNGHIIHVSKLVLTQKCVGENECPNAADAAFAHKLR